MRKKNQLIIASVAVVAVLFAGLWGVDIFRSYLTVSDTKQSDYLGKIVEIKGRVKKGTVEENATITTFVLTDYSNDISVEYNGKLPVQLAADKEVFVTGTLISREKIEASKIVTGCSSKYTS